MNIFPEEPTGDEPSGLEDYPFDLGIVPITFDDTIVVQIFSSIDIPEVDRINLTLDALMRGINFRDITELDRLLSKLPLQPVTDYQRNPETRGPYYGYDQLVQKLQGMKSGWNFLNAIYTIPGDDDEDDVYFVEIGDST